MRSSASRMAFGGMMTAVAMVIMNLGSLIPLNTYVCPVLCILIHRLVLERCGRTLGWCYYMAVSLLAMLLAPDREAALVYLFLGYYPMIRHWFRRIPSELLRSGAKVFYFTLSGATAYLVLMWFIGAEAVLAEYQGTGIWLLTVTVVLWDVLFLLVDRLLEVGFRRRK